MDPNRPYMSQAEAKEFTKLFNDLNKKIASVLLSATTLAEAEDGLGMLEGLAGYDLPEAKTMYGLALLMQDKPWYDLKKGVEWLRKGAEEAAGRTEHVAADSMYQYGIILLEGQFGVQKDPIEGKYWIDKAADAGSKSAIKEQKKRWSNMEKETKKKSTWLAGIIAIVLLAGIIGFAVYNHNATDKASKAAQEWADQMSRPWENMEIKTSQDVMRANSMINRSNLSDEEKAKASSWVYKEYAKNKEQ